MKQVEVKYFIMPNQNVTEAFDESNACQLAERCRRLERELREAREALYAAERRENDLIDIVRGKGGL